MNILNRYYTNDAISSLLISNFQQQYPQKVLELGVGGGSLLKAAYNRWKDATFYATDIDTTSIDNISNSLSFVNLFHLNGLSNRLHNKLKLSIGSIDVAVCNPPYFSMKNTGYYKGLLEASNLCGSIRLKRITSDIVFLAQNLLFLRDQGELGIILPDSILTGHDFQALREDLISNHNIIGIIQLPDKIFYKTEARTHIVLLEKGPASQNKVPLYLSDMQGSIITMINVIRDDLTHRMDCTYYLWKNNYKHNKSYLSLNDLNVDIKRGRKSKNILSKMGIDFFHTTSFPDNPSDQVHLSNNSLRDDIIDDIIATPGDILVARVGKGCVGRVTRVKSGEQVISDCVYRLRAPKKYSDIIWRELISNRGYAFLKGISHGVCAKIISKIDLLSFTIQHTKQNKDL